MDSPPTPLPLRIVIVDDDHATVFSTAVVLRIHSHQVYTAYDGAEALELIKVHDPHVVILDLAMPRISGTELVRRIREAAFYRRPFLIVHTGLADYETRNRAMAAGADMLFVKPLSFDSLNAVLDRFSNILNVHTDVDRLIRGNPAEQKEHKSGEMPGPTHSGLSAKIIDCLESGDIHCCICGRTWAQQDIRIVLIEMDHLLGDLCPACVHTVPRAIAIRLEREAHLLTMQFGELQRCLSQLAGSASVPASHADIRAAMLAIQHQFARLQATCPGIREHIDLRLLSGEAGKDGTKQLLAAISPIQNVVSNLIQEVRRLADLKVLERSTVDPAAIRAAMEECIGVLNLAAQLRSLPAWPVTVDHAIAEEKRVVSRLFAGAHAEALRQGIDNRYKAFLGQNS